MGKGTGSAGVLYVVATPIGNLQDLSTRALEVLRAVVLIAAEDTRHSRKLLAHYGIDTPMTALHEHNEREVTEKLLTALRAGKDIALVSDAGTPLISDPGFHLLRAVRQAQIRAVPVPGASACITALSVAGLPTDRFVFEGFLPARTTARRQRLQALHTEPRTLVFYEASHRICECLADMVQCLGAEREATVARELTKTYETIIHGTLAELDARVRVDPNQQKGEFVILVHGAPPPRNDSVDQAAAEVMEILLAELPLKQAATLAAKISGQSKNRLYEHGLTIKNRQQ